MNKKYISYFGDDYTQYIKDQNDIDKFNRLCDYEKKSNEKIPMILKINNLNKAINIIFELKGIKKNISIECNIINN